MNALKTLSPENQFIITCPVFRADAKIASCFQLRDHVYRGDKPPVRIGCQVALHACKCPIIPIMTRLIREKGSKDPYHSAEPRKGALDPEILNQISPVLINEKKIEESGASDAEKKALHRCNADARAGSHMKVAPKAYKKDPPPSKSKPAIDAITTAAATGDLSAAINTETAV